MFDKLNEVMDGLQKTQKGVMKTHQLRLLLWISEMCLKYNKKPEEVVDLLSKCASALKSVKRIDS